MSADLPPVVARMLDEVRDSARAALGDSLVAIVLYGSAAEGRLRPTSDLNVVFVLRSFDPGAIDALRESLQRAQAAAALTPMFLREDEIPSAAAAFAVKFDDIRRRRRVLYGPDPFASLTVARERLVARLQQVLLNLTLRLRARYALRSPFDDEVVRAVADTAGPLRSAAAALLELEGRPSASPKAALESIARSIGDAVLLDAVSRLSEARERRTLPDGTASTTFAALIELTQRMKERAQRLA